MIINFITISVPLINFIHDTGRISSRYWPKRHFKTINQKIGLKNRHYMLNKYKKNPTSWCNTYTVLWDVAVLSSSRGFLSLINIQRPHQRAACQVDTARWPVKVAEQKTRPESDHKSSIHSNTSTNILLCSTGPEHPACKHWVMRCWRGYLSRVRCK